MKTYLVGRQNKAVACDIALPENEKSISRKHMELTVTDSGRCYIVHVHSVNTTKVRCDSGEWKDISQDYVEMDTPIMLGAYETTARKLLSMVSHSSVPGQTHESNGQGKLEWDPDKGSFMHR